jgi:hypothetical protein
VATPAAVTALGRGGRDRCSGAAAAAAATGLLAHAAAAVRGQPRQHLRADNGNSMTEIAE